MSEFATADVICCTQLIQEFEIQVKFNRICLTAVGAIKPKRGPTHGISALNISLAIDWM